MVKIMADYNYFEAVEKDVKDYIKNEITFKDFLSREDLEKKLNDDLWAVDSVTGNASGSYTFNTYQAEENLTHNWNILERALDSFGYKENPIKKGAEWCDVLIRCYLLRQVIAKVLDNMEDELEDAFTKRED